MLTRVTNYLTQYKSRQKSLNKKYKGNRSIGQLTELAAINFLTNKGLILIDTNVYYRCGEIDLIMIEHNSIVFVEVKYRATDRFGSAIEAITASKAKRLIQAAETWLQRYDNKSHLSCRFDLVALSGPLDALKYQWVKNIFQ